MFTLQRLRFPIKNLYFTPDYSTIPLSLCLWNAAVTMAFRILLPIGSWECFISPWNEPIKEFRCFWTCQVQLIKGCMERKGRKQQIWGRDLFTESIFLGVYCLFGLLRNCFSIWSSTSMLGVSQNEGYLCPRASRISLHPFPGQQRPINHILSVKALLNNSQIFLKFNHLWNHQDFPKICSQRLCKTRNLSSLRDTGLPPPGKIPVPAHPHSAFPLSFPQDPQPSLKQSSPLLPNVAPLPEDTSRGKKKNQE